MSLLSILIPVTGPHPALAATLRQMLASDSSDFEILIGDFADETQSALPGLIDEMADQRLRLMSAVAAPAALNESWNAMIPEAKGDWITIIGADDYADPSIAEVIRAAVTRVPDADALSWSRADFIPAALRRTQEIAKIPVGSRLTLPEQTDMMRSRFYWDAAPGLADCEAGAFHGAVRRDLLEQVREAFSGVHFEQARPDIDNACKTVLLAKRMVFWERPLSIRSSTSGGQSSNGEMPDGFPFSPEIGETAAAAIAVEAFKQRYGIALDGWEDNFVAACARDCEAASTGEQFHARKAAYMDAISAWRGKRALSGFKPEFRRKPKIPRFKGLKDNHLHFDMAMDNSATAAAFYRLIDAMSFPVHLLEEKLA